MPQRGDLLTAAPAAPLLTAASLPSLTPEQQLAALALQLPDMTVPQILPLVKALSAQCQEGGMGGGTPESTNLMLRALFLRWAELDAPGMMLEMEKPAWGFSLTTRQFAVSSWAELRGIAAVEAVAKKWPGIANAVAWEILRRQPGQMEALLPFLTESWLPLPDEDHALIDLLGIERYVTLASAMGEQGYVSSVLGELAGKDAPAALRLLKSLPPRSARDSTIEDILGHILALPEEDRGGISFQTEYEALPPGEAKTRLAVYYGEWLAQQNVATALTWARALPPGEIRSRALAGVASALPDDSSPGEMTRLLAEGWVHFPNRNQTAVVSGFAKWRETDPAAADAWFESVGDVNLRKFLSDEVINKSPANADGGFLTEKTPGRAEHLTGLMNRGVPDPEWTAAGPEDRRDLAAAAMRGRTERLGPEKAWEFFTSLSPAERSVEAWYEAGNVRFQTDRQKASEWILTLPPGPDRDAATTALVEHLSGIKPETDYRVSSHSDAWPANERDPAAAFAWASGMSGEVERARYMAQAAQVWAVADPAAARAAVAASQLALADKESLLRQLPAETP